MKNILAVVFMLGCIGNSAAGAGEYCYEKKCWQYEAVSDVVIGGMRLQDGEYVRSDTYERTVDGKKEEGHRLATMIFSGDTVDVDIFAFSYQPSNYRANFSFSYNLAEEKLIEGKTKIDEGNEEKKSRIAKSIPDIADDLFKQHGTFSSGDSIRFLKLVNMGGSEVHVDYVLTVLGKLRQQGQEVILLRSEYAFGLASVEGSAAGFLMQDAVTGAPRQSAHTVSMKVGDENRSMKSKGYVAIMPR